MIKPEDIQWGSYSSYEGPVFWGVQKHVVPPNPSQAEAIVGVITATEGGAYDAYNGYDKCICTSGLIQWCDRAPWFLVTKLLGAVAERDVALVASVVEYASALGYTFGKTTDGAWRFWNSDGVLDTVDKQRSFYLGGSSGRRGGWSDAQRAQAKRWAAACSNVWQDPTAREVQLEYTIKRLFSFAIDNARVLLDQAECVGNNVARAFQAAFLSFAANNPKQASVALSNAIDVPARWTDSWLIDVLHHLTFDPGIAIYPERYDKIRPVLERLYNLDLPDFNGHLRTWAKTHGFGGTLPTEELQRALLVLGYDIGPKKNDGVFGDRTREALRQFERDVLIPAAFCDGYPDQYTVPRLETAMKNKGDQLRWHST